EAPDALANLLRPRATLVERLGLIFTIGVALIALAVGPKVTGELLKIIQTYRELVTGIWLIASAAAIVAWHALAFGASRTIWRRVIPDPVWLATAAFVLGLALADTQVIILFVTLINGLLLGAAHLPIRPLAIINFSGPVILTRTASLTFLAALSLLLLAAAATS